MILDVGCKWNDCGAPLEVESEQIVSATATAPCLCDAVYTRSFHHSDCPAGSWFEDLTQRRVRCLQGHFYDELVLGEETT